RCSPLAPPKLQLSACLWAQAVAARRRILGSMVLRSHRAALQEERVPPSRQRMSSWLSPIRKMLILMTSTPNDNASLDDTTIAQGSHDQGGQQRNKDRVEILRPRNPDAERKPDARHADRIKQLAAEGCHGDQCQIGDCENPHRPAAPDAAPDDDE